MAGLRMIDPLDRLRAYLSAPDVYDAPTKTELKAIVDELTELRKLK